MNTYTVEAGQRFYRATNGRTYEVTSVGAAGSQGRRVSDGPIVYLSPVLPDGTLGHPAVVVAHGAYVKPHEFTAVKS